MILGNDNSKPSIEYPCNWKYKIIGDNLEEMLKAIDDLLIDKFEYYITPSNISKKGNYYSLNLIVRVDSEDERVLIYNSLSENISIKYVL
ncbi:MAG: DUF493 domain-containing protein [Melioribacteraceae bacterium]|nr:DUF493 domain-containing protein [Melioribacteraceae bacterium]MCO6473920.1 DUF493 domain-containing protein [Melioribacteraceae bacterium]MDD3559675.1 DUF493 domain-containing protein [Melioribacteraceae bacterium]